MANPRLHWATVWGIGGYVAPIAFALYRLTPLALEPMRDHVLSGWQWLAFAVWMVFMIYTEGYKGFYRQVGPRVVARGFHLARDDQSLARRILAPLFCMALFGASRRQLIVSWCLYTGIVILIIAVRQLDQPWRGMVDAGVVAGLGLGTLAVVYFFFEALAGRPLPLSADVPEGDQREQ